MWYYYLHNQLELKIDEGVDQLEISYITNGMQMVRPLCQKYGSIF